MKLEKLNPKFLIFLYLLAFFGCVFPETRNTRRSADYSDFSAVDETTLVYWNPARKVRDYKKFFVAPVDFYGNPQVKVSPQNRGIYTEWAGKFRQKSIATLKNGFNVVDKPAAGVLKIKVDVVDIKPFVWLRKPDGTRYLRTDTVLKGTKFEVSCLDGKTKETIFASVTLFGGEKYMAYQDPALLPNVEEAYDQWLKFLRIMLEKSKKDFGAPIPNTPTSSSSPRPQ